MDIRGATRKGREFEHHACGRPMDISRGAVAFPCSEMEGGRLIDEEPANEAIAIVDNPAAASVAADGEAGRRRGRCGRQAAALLCVCHCNDSSVLMVQREMRLKVICTSQAKAIAAARQVS